MNAGGLGGERERVCVRVCVCAYVRADKGESVGASMDRERRVEGNDINTGYI